MYYGVLLYYLRSSLDVAYLLRRLPDSPLHQSAYLVRSPLSKSLRGSKYDVVMTTNLYLPNAQADFTKTSIWSGVEWSGVAHQYLPIRPLLDPISVPRKPSNSTAVPNVYAFPVLPPALGIEKGKDGSPAE